jgi:hypothetical protein
MTKFEVTFEAKDEADAVQEWAQASANTLMEMELDHYAP